MKNKPLQVFLLLLILTASSLMVAPVKAQSTQNSLIIGSSGEIIKDSSVHVTVDPSITIASNNLSLGFVLDHHWNEWLDSPRHRQIAQEGNFKLIRIYDFESDSGIRLQPCSYWDEKTMTGIFNWTNVDELIQSFYAIQAEPLICLGGTCGDFTSYFPNGMHLNNNTGLPNPESYASYCAAWVRHFKEVGFPVRFYEIFNEIEQLYFTYDDPRNYNEAILSDFFSCFNACYNSMHAENNQVLVGNDASLYRTFLDYWVAHGGKLDFLSFHKYQCTGINEPDNSGLVRAEQRYFESDEIWYSVKDARERINANLPAICSEYGWCAQWTGGTDPRNQQLVSAVALALTLRQEVLLNVQYNLYYAYCSNAVWQSTKGTGFGFGMINDDNLQPWYQYYVNQLIGSNLSVGDLVVTSSSSSSDVRTLAWINNEKLFTLVICKVDSPTTITLGSFANSAKYSLIDNTYAYTEPKVQTGILNANNQLELKGYAVLLVESINI